MEKNIIEEFSEFSRDQQLIFYAVYHGIKKSMDIWISDRKFQDFLNFCDRNNIYYKYDIKFLQIHDENTIKNTAWWKNLTSTKATGVHHSSNIHWWIHTFLSKKQEYVNNLFKYWWYPMVQDKRVINKSFQDVQDFGNALWYPECCRKFFYYYNNWNYRSFLYEIFLKSSKYDYRCNCLWKDNPLGKDYSYIYHMPCSFDCEETKNYVDKIEEKLEIEAPEILEECRYYLKLPCLVIRELKIYAFEWFINQERNELSYTKCYILGKPNEGSLLEFIEQWNRVVIEKDFLVHIYKDNSLIHTYDASKSEKIEHPFLIQFT